MHDAGCYNRLFYLHPHISLGVPLKPASLGLLVWAVMTVLFLSACGSDSSTTVAPPVTSQIAKRVYVSSAFTGVTFIVDGATDSASSFTVSTTGRPAIMQTVIPQQLTVVYEDLNHTISLIDNSQENVVATINMTTFVNDLAVQSDARFIYAARGAQGRIDILDVVNRSVSTTPLNTPSVRRLALAPNNSKLLVFSEPSDAASNSVQVFTLTNGVGTEVNAPGLPGFDRAYTAVFSSDSSRAYVLSCGKECGGTQAKVTILDMTTSVPTVVGSVNVEGATVALLNGSTLYVAGTRSDSVARINVVNVANAATPTVTASATIQPGLHRFMALGATNKLFVGGSNCGGLSCLTIFDTSANSATGGATTNNGASFGDVTSIQPISGRNTVYVVEGGDLKIYDTTTSALQARQINTTGALSVLNQVDQ
jgi:hypothetical protein